MREAIEKIAAAAEALAFQANVGGCETAGLIVSFLAENPDQIEAFERNPAEFLLREDLRWHNGRLTWHAMSGKVVTPQQYREHVAAKQIMDQASAAAETPQT